MGYTPPTLYVNKVAGGWSLTPPSTTIGDDLFIYPNASATAPSITMLAGDSITIASPGDILIQPTTTGRIKLSYTSPDLIIENTIANKNIYLKATGTGQLKVPLTATATGDVAINGHYDILDSTGATIKLATVA